MKHHKSVKRNHCELVKWIFIFIYFFVVYTEPEREVKLGLRGKCEGRRERKRRTFNSVLLDGRVKRRRRNKGGRENKNY